MNEDEEISADLDNEVISEKNKTELCALLRLRGKAVLAGVLEEPECRIELYKGHTLAVTHQLQGLVDYLERHRQVLEEHAQQVFGPAIVVVVMPAEPAADETDDWDGPQLKDDPNNAERDNKIPPAAKPTVETTARIVANDTLTGTALASRAIVARTSSGTAALPKNSVAPVQPNRAARRRAQHDREKIEKTLRRFCRNGDAIEIRALNCQPGNFTTIGYFNEEHLSEAARLATEIKNASGIYCTINPVKADLLARAANRLQPRPKFSGTSDGDIARRVWLFLDFDPVHSSGISATDEEKSLVFQRAEECRQSLADRGWVPPIFADSGNGAHLDYPVALPNDDTSRVLIERVLKSLALTFSDDRVALDLTTFNAARITKLYGTVAAKGDDTEQRPHRLSVILEDPRLHPGEIVTKEQLAAVAALAPEEPTRVSGSYRNNREFDLEDWIRKYNLPVRGPFSYGTDLKWLGLNGQNCLFGGDHDADAFFVIKRSSGPIQAGCRHDSCAGKTWRELRLQYEPDAYSRTSEPVSRVPAVVTGNGAPAIIEPDPDPVLAALDQALITPVDTAGITFEPTRTYLINVRAYRGQTRVLCQDVLRSHSLAMLVGRAWAGKSTIAAYFARCLQLGEPFFGHPCEPSRVGYMGLERNGEQVAVQFEQWGIDDKIVFRDYVPQGQPTEMARALARAIRQSELDVVFVDHLIGLINMRDGNDYVGVSQALLPFNALAKYTGAVPLLLHHQPKSILTGLEINVMGSEAFRAATDTLLEASRIGSLYFLRGQARGCPDLDRFKVMKDAKGILTTPEESNTGVEEAVLEAFESIDGKVSAEKLVEKVPALANLHSKSLLRALKSLSDTEKLTRYGRRHNYVYELNQASDQKRDPNNQAKERTPPGPPKQSELTLGSNQGSRAKVRSAPDDPGDLDEYGISRSK